MERRRFATHLKLYFYSLCAKGELDDDAEVEWRDGGDKKTIDSEGKPYKTYHGDSQHI